MVTERQKRSKLELDFEVMRMNLLGSLLSCLFVVVVVFIFFFCGFFSSNVFVGSDGVFARELSSGIDFLRHRILREDFVDNFDDGAIVIFEVEKTSWAYSQEGPMSYLLVPRHQRK